MKLLVIFIIDSKYVFILCGTNNIVHNSPQSFASIIISSGLAYQKQCHLFQVFIIPLLPRNYKHSRRRRIINTVNKLLNFQCYSKGFHFFEFKSNWLNNDESLKGKSFTMMAFTLYKKTMDYWQKN